MRKGYKVTVSINKKPLKKLKLKKIGKGKDKKTTVKRSANKKKVDDNITKGIDIINHHKEVQEEIRQERIGKTLVEVHNELLDIEKEKLRKLKVRRRIVFTTLLIIILILIYLFFTYGPIFGISVFKDGKISEDKKVDIVSTEEDIYLNYCDELLVYNNRKLTTYNTNLNKTWEYELQEVFTPNIYVNGKYMVILNKTNGTINLFESKKELLTKRIDGDISYVYIKDTGEFAVEYSTSGYKKVIGVYSKNGKLLYNTYLQDSSIIDVKFLDLRKLLVVTSDSTSFNIGITLNIIDGTKEQNNIQELVKFENNLVYDIKIKNNNAIILLDNKIVNCNLKTGSTTPIKTFEDSQVLFTSLASNYYTFVEKSLGENKEDYIIKTLRFDNTEISSSNIQNLPKQLNNSGYLNYFIYQDKLQVINKWGVEVNNININFPPKDIIIFNKEKCAALIYSNKIYFVNM